jgi:hypothetical protein
MQNCTHARSPREEEETQPRGFSAEPCALEGRGQLARPRNYSRPDWRKT